MIILLLKISWRSWQNLAVHWVTIANLDNGSIAKVGTKKSHYFSRRFFVFVYMQQRSKAPRRSHQVPSQYLALLNLCERKHGLGLTNCSFKSQVILDLSIFSWVFLHPVVPGVGTEKPVLSFQWSKQLISYSFVYFITLLNLTSYECQGFSVDPILRGLTMVSKISIVQLPVFWPSLYKTVIISISACF
jgi:hypothetical protein